MAASLVLGSVAPILAAPQGQAARAVVVSQAKSPIEMWNDEMAAAKLRQTKGHQLHIGGVLVAIGGPLLSGFIALHCRGAECGFAFPVGLGGLVGGIAMGFVGWNRAHDASAEIAALLMLKPGAPGPVGFRLRVDSPLSITVGPATSITYRVRW